MIIIPEEIEKLVKKLEPHKDDVESPWGLATWMRKKGYKMPAKAEEEVDEKREFRKSFEKQWDKPEPKPEPKKATEEKYKLPAPKQEKELNHYDKHITDKEHALKKLYGKADLSQDAQKRFKKKLSEELKKRDSELKPIPKKAEEEIGHGTGKDIPRVMTPKEQMEYAYTPKGKKPTYIDTVPSGKGKSLEEWASEKKETPSIKKMHRDYITSPESLLDDWKPGATLPIVRKSPYAGKQSSEIIDMFIAEEKEGLLDKIKSGIKDLISSPKVKSYEKPTPLTKTFVRKQMQRAEEEFDPTKGGGIPAPVKAEEEGKRPAGPIDVSKGAPPGFEKKKDWGIPKKAEEETTSGSKPLQTMKPSDKIKSRLGDMKSLTHQLERIKSKAEEERRLSPIRRSMKSVPHEKDVIRHLDVIDAKPSGGDKPLKAEEEERVGQKRSPYGQRSKFEKPMNLIDTIGVNVKHPTSGRIVERATPTKLKKMVEGHIKQKAEEETQYRPIEPERDTTKWERDRYEQKTKPLLTKVREKLFGEKAEEDVRGPTPDVGKISLPSEKDWTEAKVYKNKISDKLSKVKAEEDQTSDYIESLSKRKLPGWTKPKGPKPESEVDLPSERLSAKYINQAEEELDEPQKEFDEDALNELYCFLRWQSDHGFKAESGDELENLIDRYDIEKFSEKSEEMQPPAKFQAPEKKSET